MSKRGSILALGVVLLLASALAFVSSSQPVAAYPCCTSDDGCGPDASCDWPGGWSCGFFLGQCNRITDCGSLAYADDCDSDSECGSDKYCSFDTKSAYVAVSHTCDYVSANECLSCSYPSADCNFNGGCETTLSSDVNNCGSCGNTCQSGYSCQSGSCTPPACIDGDGDGYGTNCAKGTDCNDANALVYPGSCSSAAVTWSGCATSTTGGCGSGTCTRPLPSGCGDVCGDGKVTGSEKCEPGVSSGTKFCGSYASVSYGCKSDCTWESASCPYCGDGTCQSAAEDKTSCAADCENCGNGFTDAGEACDPNSVVTGSKTVTCGDYPSITQTCKSDCSGYDETCASCGDGAVTGSETCEPGVTAQPTCPDGSSQTCSPSTCTWQGICPVGCRSNAECPVSSADQCSGLKTVDRSVGGYCTASHSCQFQYGCVSGSCGAQCSVGSYSNVGCSTGFTKNCNSGCSWSGCVACTDADGDGFYAYGGCGTAVDCNDGAAAYTTSCPAAAGGGYCGDGTCQSTESQYSCPSDCRVAIRQTCSDGLRNQDEAGVDCGGVCASSAVEVCDGADNDRDCLVDEGEMCNPCASPVAVSDADTSKACCLYKGFKWGRSGELSIPSYDVKVDNYAAQESGYVGGEVTGSADNVYRLTGNVLSGYASFVSQSTRLRWKKDLASLLSASTRDRFYTASVSGKVMGGAADVNTEIKVGGGFSPSRIAGTPDNGVVVVGTMGGTGSASSWDDKSQGGVLVAKLDSAGDLVWKAYWRGVAEHWSFGLWNPEKGLFGGQDYDGFGNEYFGAFDVNEGYKYSFEAPIVAVNAAGEVLVTGRMRTARWEKYCIEGHPYYGNCPDLFRVVPGVSDYLIKISGSGQIVGSTVAGLFSPSGLFSYSYERYPQAADVAYAPGTGGFYAVGTHSAYYGSTYILSKIGPGLNVEWNAFEPISQNFRNAMSVAYDANLNRVVVVGSIRNLTTRTLEYSVWVHDPATGRVVSRFSFDTPADDQGFDVVVDADGGYVVAGTAGIVKFDNKGRKLWNKTAGSAVKNVRWLSSGQNKFLVGVAAVDYPLKTVEANVLVDAQNAYGQFADSAGERKAGGTMLGLDAELCVGDDASELFFLRSRQCDAGVCSTDVSDAVVCDKASDCVFQGRCYSDVDRVAATYFGNDRAGVWGSVWKPEVAADVDADGQLELCDPGQWFEPTGSVVGFVKDTAGTGLDAATVRISGTSYSATSVAGGAYAVNSVFPGSYDFVASRAGYFDNASQTGIVVVPVTPTSVNFTLVRAVATVSGTVTNVSGDPVAGAVVSIVGTVFNTLTGPDGRYSLPGVQPGFYDLAAGKDSDGYGDSLVLNRQVVAPETAADFVLLKSSEGCNDDCTKIGGNLCDAGCHGKGLCWFYSEETKQACDGTFGIISISGGRQVGCCEGKPYTPIKADVTIRAKEIIKTVKSVVYQGKLVKLVTLVFTPER